MSLVQFEKRSMSDWSIAFFPLPDGPAMTTTCFMTLILANRSLRVNLLDHIKDHGYHDEERGAAYGERGNAGDALQNDGQHGEEPEEKRADEREARNDVAEVFSGRTARAHARDERAVFLEVFCDLIRFKGNGRIKIGEHEYESKVERAVYPVVG